MNESIQKLLKKLAEDPETAAKLRAVKDPDEAYAVVSSIQDGFTKEEFIAAAQEIRASMQSSGDLSDEDLSKVAGGVTSEDVAKSAGEVISTSMEALSYAMV